VNCFAVFLIRIRPDLKSFSLKDPDPNILLILDPDPDPLFYTSNYEISFRIVLKSEQIHQDKTHNSWKIINVEDFNPFVSSY